MELKITKGRGKLAAFTLSANGRDVLSLVSDPANMTAPRVLREWLNQSGGVMPLDAPKTPEPSPLPRDMSQEEGREGVQD